MSETTVTNTKSSAVSDAVAKFKKSFTELSFVKNFVEFKRETIIALSLATNQVTKFNALSVAVFIMSAVHLVSIIIGVHFGYFRSTMLIVPLQVFSVAGQLYVLSYLFPIVQHMMEFNQKKRNKRLKAEWKAEQKSLKEQQQAAEEAQIAENGTYVI